MIASIPSPLPYTNVKQNKLLPIKKRNRLSCKFQLIDKRKEQHVHRRTIRFCPIVSVVMIPSRLDYTESERENMWISIDDQIRGRQRNSVEFAYEKEDWRQVVDEKDFIFVHGQWIHPVHVNNAFRRYQMRLALERIQNKYNSFHGGQILSFC